MTKIQLYQVPVASTSFVSDSYLDDIEGEIRFDFLKEGAVHRGGIRFDGILAVKMRTERSCNVWHVKDAYDTLVEIEGSPWVEEIRADTNERWRGTEMHHYLIYLDSSGAFEVVAEGWSIIPAEPGTWRNGTAAM